MIYTEGAGCAILYGPYRQVYCMSTLSDNATEAATTPRQRNILKRVREQGFVAIEELARAFEVTPQTVRRDINALCSRGMLRRYHGGAGLPSSVENVAYSTRRVLNLKAKQRIAELVASHIPDEASLFISLGTTTEEAARALHKHKGLRVITNNLQVAAMLSGNSSFEVMVAGGVVRSRDAGITGEAAIDFFRHFKVDIALMGISSIETDGTLFDFDFREVRVLRTIMENARNVWLMADHSKYGRNALVHVGSITEVDALFTDRQPPESLARVMEEADTPVYVAE